MHDRRRLRSRPMNPGTPSLTPDEELLLTAARLRIAAMQLEQADALRDIEFRRCSDLETVSANAPDVETLREAHLRVEIASVAASAAEGRLEALRMQLRDLEEHR